MASPPSLATAAECLGDDTIAGMLEGILPDEVAARSRFHLAACDACRRLVSAAIDAGGAGASGVPTGTRESRAEARPTTGDARIGELAPGVVVSGKFRVERFLGEGGMGRVFVARQLDLDRPVALKIIRRELAEDIVALGRFQREARLIASLMSEHVVRVHELGQLPTGEPYLVMELLVGEDLGAIVRRAPVPVATATGWVRSACDALAEAHALGIVHRDIKPQNLFLASTGGGQRIKVLDFGLAKLATRPGATGFTGITHAASRTALTADDDILGSPRYMAPEQITGASTVDARADVWSLGVTLYHLVAGTPPFMGRDLDDLLGNILRSAPPPLDAARPDVTRELAEIVHRCLAKDPQARFATALELSHALAGTQHSFEVPRLAETVDGESEPAATTHPSAPHLAGTVLDGRYELVERIGQGGQGTVYRAKQRPLGRLCAIKVLRWEALSAPGMRERFVREAAIVQRLEHPNTVRMYEFGVAEDGLPFLVFELVRGKNLAEEIRRGPLVPGRVARIATQALKALMEAHELGIIHRDVKPANVLLVDHAGEVDFVKLVDFGVARSEEQEGLGLTHDGQLVGTPRYMAPEQLAGTPVDLRCDLYALGLVIAEALTGRPVYESQSVMELYATSKSTAPVPLAPEVLTSALGTVVARATQKSREARFASAGEMLEAITQIETTQIERPPTDASRARTRAARVGSVVALVVAVVGVVCVVFLSMPSAKRDAPGAVPSGASVTPDETSVATADEDIPSSYPPLPLPASSPASSVVVVPPRARPLPASSAPSASSVVLRESSVAPRNTVTPGAGRPPIPVPRVVIPTLAHPKPPEATGNPSDPAFDKKAASAAIARVSLAHCTHDGLDKGRLVVTFAPTGLVSDVGVVGVSPDTKPCVAAAYRTARVPPFSGHPEVLVRDFKIP